MAYKQISPQPVVEGGTGAVTLTGVLTGNGTSAVTANAVTQYAVLVGGASNAVGNVASVGASGQVLTSNGAGSNPTFQDNASGDVSGPGSSTDNALARWNGTGGDTLQDSTVIVTDNGEMTNASQPAFNAYLATNDDNVTGNGTAYILGQGNALTEVTDQNGDFDPGGSGGSGQATFTAPVDGFYFLTAHIQMEAGSGATENTLWIRTSNGNFREISLPTVTTSGATRNATSLAVCVFLDASDTAYVEYSASGVGADTMDADGSSTRFCFFSGFLAC